MTCSIPACGKPIKHKSKALCNAHYQRWYRTGDPLGSGGVLRRPPGLSATEVFAWYMPGEPPAEGCWDWTASLNDNGYGQFTANGIQFRAHVVSHSLYNTDDPVTDDRPYVLHSCDRPICVQPAHLRAGTPAENMADGVSRQRWPIGEGHYHAKLSETDVLSIRSCRGRVTETELARRFGVARTTIADVLHGRTWTHLVSPDRNEQMSKDNDERFCRAFHLNVDPQGNVSFRCEYCGETRTKVQPCPGPPERSATH